MDEDRLKHSYAVAMKMTEFGKKRGYSEEKIHELFLLGFNHDIGYQYGESEKHGEIGADILKHSGYKYWQEVYYHGKAGCLYKSEFLDILNAADMSIDKFGRDVGVEKRLEDVRIRYGKESIPYTNCVNLVNELKGKGDL